MNIGLISINQTKKDAIGSDKTEWAELCEWKLEIVREDNAQ